jgi:hypothetical protein
MEKAGARVDGFPLGFYRRTPLRGLRIAALDRFGTDLEQRFSRSEIERMMVRSGLENIQFQDREPYWVALGRKAARSADGGT